MDNGAAYFRRNPGYRIWVDDAGVGRIRVLKRINFKTVVSLFEELHAEIKKKNPGTPSIVFYISRSLHDEMSVNAKEFLQFCSSCMGVKFDLVLIEL